MDVSALSFGNSSAQAESAARTPKDEFLRLLVAQLQHQNPLQPMDSAQFVAQLAQFAQVEQSAETNVRLGSLEAVASADVRAGFTNLVGRVVTARATECGVEKGAVIGDWSARLGGAADSVEVVVRDADGNEVRRMSMGAQDAGDMPITWDGLDKDGNPVADGSYSFEVIASKDGSPVQASTMVRGLVRSLDFEDGNIVFAIGPTKVTPADIVTIEA